LRFPRSREQTKGKQIVPLRIIWHQILLDIWHNGELFRRVLSLLSVLGIVDAALGRKQQAIQEASRATEMLPISKDAESGPGLITNLAIRLRVDERIRAGFSGTNDFGQNAEFNALRRAEVRPSVGPASEQSAL